MSGTIQSDPACDFRSPRPGPQSTYQTSDILKPRTNSNPTRPMMEYQICVVSNDSELVQLIRSSLSSSAKEQRTHPHFKIVHSPAAEPEHIHAHGGLHALIVDARRSTEYLAQSGLKHISLPIITIGGESPGSSSINKENNVPIYLIEENIPNPIFPVLITQAIIQQNAITRLKNINTKLNKKIDDLQSIHQASLRITENLSLTEVLDGILKIALDMIGADDSIILLYEEGLKDHRLEWDFERDLNSNITSSIPKDNLYVVSKGGKIELGKDYPIHPVFIYPDFQGSIYDLELIVNDVNIGGMTVGFRETHHFSADEKSILQMLADQAAIAIENARLYKIARSAAVAEERIRLARELHDSIAQALYGITLFTKASQRDYSQNQLALLQENLATIQRTAQDALQEMRLLLFELRPAQLEREGLIPALIGRLEMVEERSGIRVDFQIEGDPLLPDEIEDAYYLIIQEALNNSLKYAQASEVMIRIKNSSSGSEMLVSDNGVGFNLDQKKHKKGMGLLNMAERTEQIGGKLTIESNPGEGTKIRVEVPRG